jgi:serine/threonine protein kinase
MRAAKQGPRKLCREKQSLYFHELVLMFIDLNHRWSHKNVNFRILSGLKHPHIVMYHESFFDEDEVHLCIIQVYFTELNWSVPSDMSNYSIQDYCDGGTLDDRIKDASQVMLTL